MTSVVNEDDFKSPSHFRTDLDTASQKLIQVLFFIINRNHHGNFQLPIRTFFCDFARQRFTSFNHVPENLLHSLHHVVHIFKGHIRKEREGTDAVRIPFRVGKHTAPNGMVSR